MFLSRSNPLHYQVHKAIKRLMMKKNYDILLTKTMSSINIGIHFSIYYGRRGSSEQKSMEIETRSDKKVTKPPLVNYIYIKRTNHSIRSHQSLLYQICVTVSGDVFKWLCKPLTEHNDATVRNASSRNRRTWYILNTSN